jgi:antibiotic biosynthesis monooxygenase (ABM) superfamily enzyme
MSTDESLTVVVTRIIKPGCDAAFEQTMREFLEVAWTFPGHRGMHMLRPAENADSGEYTIVARFDSMAARRVFTSSQVFQEWMARMDAQSVGAPVVRELRNIEGWAALAGETVNPPRWKMALTVWVGVTCLSELFAVVLYPVTASWPHALQIPATTMLTVAVLTWVVLPWAVRALNGWYFPRRKP